MRILIQLQKTMQTQEDPDPQPWLAEGDFLGPFQLQGI
jgi:hypothetical protein